MKCHGSPSLLLVITTLLLGVVCIGQAKKTCPFDHTFAKAIDYAPIREACDARLPLEQRGISCTCAFVHTLGPPLLTTKIVVDVNAVTREEAVDGIMACSDVMMGPMIGAGISIFSLSDMTKCPPMPTCQPTAPPEAVMTVPAGGRRMQL